MIEALKLLSVFIAILIILRLSKSLLIALVGGIIGVALLFGLGIGELFAVAATATIDKMTITVVSAFYSITFLQRMLEKRGDLRLAQRALSGIINNRRVNAALTPILVGLLPSAGAVAIAGALLEDTVGDNLTKIEKTFVASYFRHIPESIFPTYPSIIIGLQLTGVPVVSFMLLTFPLIIVLMVLGYVFYLRKLPVDTGLPPSKDKIADAKNLMRGLWTIVASIHIIIVFNLPVSVAVLVVILLNAVIRKFSWTEIKPMFASAFETQLIISTVLIMIFKDVIGVTGAVAALPAFFQQLPMPHYVTYLLLFMFGTVLAGQQAISVIALPLVFSEPGADSALFVLLMAGGYAAMQVSPTHICLAIVTKYFGTTLGALVKKTLPVMLIFCIILIAYYLMLDAWLAEEALNSGKAIRLEPCLFGIGPCC